MASAKAQVNHFLPSIVHPSKDRPSREFCVLGSAGSRRRPSSCPEPCRFVNSAGERPTRSPSTSGTDELVSLISLRLRGAGVFSLKQSFKAFDHKGQGNVTREALYRLLCNFLSGITLKQFNSLLERLDLDSVSVISFEEFYSRFHVPSSVRRWLDPVSRPLTGRQATPATSDRLVRRQIQKNREPSKVIQGGDGGLLSHLGQVEQKIVERCQQLDTYKSGKLTVEQLRVVLSEFGVRITPLQMTDICTELGYRDGQLIKYLDVLAQFTSRSDSGIVHTVLTSKTQRFHRDDPKRACTSMGDAQTRLVTLLHDKFLKLLADFKSHDKHSKGYIQKNTFVSILQSHLGVNADIDPVVQALTGDEEWVPYPKFLSMFEHSRPPSVSSSPPQADADTDCRKLNLTIREFVTNHTQEFIQAFYEADVNNTGRLTLTTATELLERFGVKCTLGELKSVWNGLLKNKNGTVNFQEFLRQFASRPNTVEGMKGGRHLTEDHCFMRSKTLHRDDDIVLDYVRSRLRYHQPTLLKHLSKVDTAHSGKVPIATFMECVTSLCPDLTPEDVSVLTHKFQDPNTGTVSYNSALSIPRPNPYRDGSNMATVLTHKARDGLTETSPPLVLAARPPYGLPGVKVYLQRQLAKHWRLIRRLFRGVDKSNCGSVSIGEFWVVLEECGVELSPEEKFHILELLDPQLSGRINYSLFINAIFEQ